VIPEVAISNLRLADRLEKLQGDAVSHELVLRKKGILHDCALLSPRWKERAIMHPSPPTEPRPEPR